MSQKHLVFLFHGMGDDKENWSKKYTDQLIKISKNYNNLKPAKNSKKSVIEESINFKEIKYNNFFEKALEDMGDNSKKILDILKKKNEKIPEFQETFEWILDLSKRDDFFKTHLMDVILWKIDPFLRNRIITAIANEMAPLINKQIDYKNLERRVSIIAYSLGTSVCHDTINALASGSWNRKDEYNGLAPIVFHFHSIHMISNVSYLLESSDSKVYKPFIKPGPWGDEGSYCMEYHTYKHDYDPFTWPKEYNPPWKDESGYTNQPISSIGDWNTHSLTHYLDNPLVHIPIFERLFESGIITPDEEDKAIESHLNKTLKFKDQESVKKKMKVIGNIFRESPDLKALVKGLRKLL